MGVFKPPLNVIKPEKGISKLMVQENGLDEILTTQKIAKKLELIPKYKKSYFIKSF